jgi:hypothetical protein
VDLTRITEIVRERYESGTYGNAHFKVARSVVDEMRQHVPTPKPGTYGVPLFPGYSIGDLTGIPVLVDDALPTDQWQLIDNSTGVVLASFDQTEKG